MLEDRILQILEKRKFDGILQAELPKILDASKSRISEVLSILEKQGIIVRRKEAGKNLKVWLKEYSEGSTKIGILRAVEYAKLVSAGEYSFIIYRNAIDLTRDLALGRIDIGASPLVTQIMFGVMMKTIKIKRVVAENGSGIVYGDSNNKIFATTEMSAMEMNLRAVKNKLGIEGFRYCQSPECLISSLSEVEGIAIWEPYFSSLNRDKIPFSELEGDYPCCTLAFNTDYLYRNFESVRSLLKDFERSKIDIAKVSSIFDFREYEIKTALKSYRFNPRYEFEDLVEYMKKGGLEISPESLSTVFDDFGEPEK